MIQAATIDAGLVSPSLRLAIHEAEGGGYWAEIPAFPGVYAEGETLAEVHREAEATVARYFEARARKATESPEGWNLADADGPIPVIVDRADDLGVRLPLPSRVKAVRASAMARTERLLERLADDPPGTDDALIAALDERRPVDGALAERVNGA